MVREHLERGRTFSLPEETNKNRREEKKKNKRTKHHDMLKSAEIHAKRKQKTKPTKSRSKEKKTTAKM